MVEGQGWGWGWGGGYGTVATAAAEFAPHGDLVSRRRHRPVVQPLNLRRGRPAVVVPGGQIRAVGALAFPRNTSTGCDDRIHAPTDAIHEDVDREIVLSASVVVRTGDVTGGRFRESREYRQFRRTEVFSIQICGAIVLCT